MLQAMFVDVHGDGEGRGCVSNWPPALLVDGCWFWKLEPACRKFCLGMTAKCNKPLAPKKC